MKIPTTGLWPTNTRRVTEFDAADEVAVSDAFCCDSVTGINCNVQTNEPLPLTSVVILPRVLPEKELVKSTVRPPERFPNLS
jgi:hypothetical protein